MVKVIKKYLIAVLALTSCLPLAAKKEKILTVGENAHYVVTMRTSAGTVKFRLFNDTPMHRDNIVRLVKSGFYDYQIFHRVIRDFMIQVGDPASKEASQVAVYGGTDAGYKIDPEIRPGYFHRRGAVAAAREGDALNPERRSSGSQFYIVTGKIQTDSTLAVAKRRIAEQGGSEITPAREKIYRSVGGVPHLDGSYTIFGEVIQGMKVVDRISKTKTDTRDRPIDDVYIREIAVELVKNKKGDNR